MNLNYTTFLTDVLTKASLVAHNNFGKVVGEIKENNPNQILTETDLEIGKLIIEAIKTNYPRHNIIDEEAGVINLGSQYTFVVDPIDGTSNFAKGVAAYGIMIGLLDGGMPIAAGIALPEFSQIYTAEKDHGAFCNGQPIHVSSEQSLINSLVAYGIDGHKENPQKTQKECLLLSEIVLNIRNLRASNSVLDFALVACGQYEAYLNQSSKIWDNVAAQLIIEEAGGVYTDFFGQKIDYSNPLQRAHQNFTYCAASTVIHQQLQDIIKHNFKV